jgi:hypothetical protein
VPAKQRDLAFAQQQQPVFGAGFVAFEDAARALEPAGRNGGVAPEREIIPHEPEGHARGAQRVVRIAIELVGALARAEGARRVIEPPRREPELLPRRGRLCLGQAVLELNAGLFPRAAGEGGATRLDQSGRGVFQSLVMMNSGAPSN